MTPHKIIEAILFASESPMRPEQIADIFINQTEEENTFGITAESAQNILEELKTQLQEGNSIYQIRRINQGYQLYTKQSYYPWVRTALMMQNKKKLSRASMETLSIIAYRQPVTKTEIEFIRGVNCDYAVRKLLDKKLVEIVGRSDAVGRPLLYGSSPYFMEYFGLNNIKDLPKLEEISVDEGEYQAQFKVYLEEKEESNEE